MCGSLLSLPLDQYGAIRSAWSHQVQIWGRGGVLWKKNPSGEESILHVFLLPLKTSEWFPASVWDNTGVNLLFICMHVWKLLDESVPSGVCWSQDHCLEIMRLSPPKLVIFNICLTHFSSLHSTRRATPTMKWSCQQVFCIYHSLFFLWGVELHCGPKLLKPISERHCCTGWHVPSSPSTHCSLFWLSPTYTVMLPQMLTRPPRGFIHHWK